MAKMEYSKQLCRKLGDSYKRAELEVDYHPERYDAGDLLRVNIEGVEPALGGAAELEIDKFLGGGFAGQVYRCRLKELELEGEGRIPGLETGGLYAVKIIIPPGKFSHRFRNLVYWLAFQGPFSSQVNYGACRSGLIWQKLFRRAAAGRFDGEHAVKDAYASFWDPELNSYGEITEWVEGRMWRLETDAHIRRRLDWRGVDLDGTESAEFLAKRRFMAGMVDMMHAMGAPEFARQYEWWTMKSQPNSMKRSDVENCNGPDQGLCAIDFRAGLALLPWLPMSPGDIKLIFDGLFKRHTLVQFDRCDLGKLDNYITDKPKAFTDSDAMLSELRLRDREYRRSLPDITHHGLRIFSDRELRRDLRAGLIEGYRAARLVDEAFAEKLARGGLRFAGFYLLGALPLIGKALRRLWGNAAERRHRVRLLSDRAYLRRAVAAKTARSLIGWHRGGRASEPRARFLAEHPWIFVCERCTLGLLPIPLHRLAIRPLILWDALVAFLRFLHQFIVSADYREEWFLNEIAAGEKAGMLTPEERREIESKVKDPFIVKYLKCLGVHFATLPVTQIVSLIVAGIVYGWMIANGNGHGEAALAFGGVLFVFQITPISPGSICRGGFVLYLMIRERNWRDYLVAAPLSFVKYIGYLAFPLQMTTTYPHLARFMASRWATEATHIIPVFGEQGALLEHWVFDIFFNIPQSAARHIKGLLTAWMLFGMAVAAATLFLIDFEIKGWVNINLALIVVFVLPRMLFYPLLRGKKRDAVDD